MASKEQILGILAGESGSMNRTVLGKRLGLSTHSFQNQLDRMEGQKLVEKNEQNEYTITEAGRQFALAEAPPAGEEPPPEEATEESLKTTEYQQFVEMGKTTGVTPLALIEQTATHIWRGGDYLDLDWVWKGLTEMGIRPDLVRRWFHTWRSFLHQPVPSSLAGEAGVMPKSEGEKEAAKAEASGKGKRDYILGPNDTPLKVGDGLGDLDYDDAVRLSTVRAAALARGGAQTTQGQPITPGTMADEVVKIYNAFRETVGPQTKGKSYVVKPGEDGYKIEEVEEGKPTIIASPGSNNKPSPSFIIDSEGNIEEAPPGRPVVIKHSTPLPTPQSAKTYLLRQTPEGVVTEEYEPGKPIIINTAPPLGSNSLPMMPFPVMDADGKPVMDDEGKPVYANLEPMMKWMGFQADQRREEEKQTMLRDTVKTVRENLGDGVSALRAAAEEAKGSSGSKTPASEPQQQVFSCGACGTQFSPPPGWAGQSLKCPNPACGREYQKEELIA